MKATNNIILILSFFFIVFESNAQSIIEEQTYKLAWSSSINDGIKSGDNMYISLVNMDSTNLTEFDYLYSNLANLGADNNILWNNECQRFSTNVLLFFNTQKEIVIINDFFKVHVGQFVGDFYPSLSRIDTFGNLLFKNIDTASQQSKRINSTGLFHRYNGDRFINTHYYLDSKDSVHSLITKQFDQDANFIKEDTSGFLKRSDVFYRISLKNIILNFDSTFIIIAQIYNKENNSVSSYISIIKLNKKFQIYDYTLLGPYDNTSISDAENINLDEIAILTRASNLKEKTSLNSIIVFNKLNNKTKEIKFSQYDEVLMTSLEKSDNNLIYIGGFIWKYDEQKYSFFASKLDINLEEDWHLIWGEDQNSKSINKLLIEEDKGLLTILGSKGNESYLAVISIPTSLLASELRNWDIQISPNPASDCIEISIPPLERGLGGVSVKIYDVLGIEHPATAWHPSTEGNSVRIDISALAPGGYFVKVGERVSKFVKM